MRTHTTRRHHLAAVAAVALAVPQLVAAQAGQTSASVAIGGHINAQFESIGASGATLPLSAADAARVSTRTRANQNGSELRFSGQRTFANGLEGFFSIASEVQSFSGGNANNTATFAIRNTGVGLRGGFGEIALGRWDSHYHWGSLLVDNAYLTQGLANDSKALITYVNGTVFTGSRFANTIRYNTPTFSGLTGHAIYSRNDGGVSTLAGVGDLEDESVNLAAVYRRSGLNAFASYFDRRNVNINLPFAASPTPSAMRQKSARAGVSYELFSGFTLGAIVDVTRQTHRTAATSLGMKRTAWAIPAKYATGPHQIALTYASAGDSSGSLMPASVVGSNRNTGAKYLQVGYQYALDKNTNIHAGIAQVRNAANGTYDFALSAGLGLGGSAGVRGVDPRTFQVGMRYAF